jgi:haloacid dehalogenase superfamily, subfamily IA, variant 1 with third motif having Dx(3-4)D or Dx(3-4)E
MYNIIFDLDGTLWDTTFIVAEAWKNYVKENYDSNFDVNEDILKGLFGKTMTEIAGILFPNATKEKCDELIEGCCEAEHEALRRQAPEVYQGVREGLRNLKDAGHRMFIVSNCQQGYIELFIEASGLEEFFEGTLCAGDTGKPKGYNIKKIIADYQIENPIYVGDTKGDHEATIEAQVPFVLAEYGFGDTKEPDYRIREFSELISLMKA